MWAGLGAAQSTVHGASRSAPETRGEGTLPPQKLRDGRSRATRAPGPGRAAHPSRGRPPHPPRRLLRPPPDSLATPLSDTASSRRPPACGTRHGVLTLWGAAKKGRGRGGVCLLPPPLTFNVLFGLGLVVITWAQSPGQNCLEIVTRKSQNTKTSVVRSCQAGDRVCCHPK